jgi:hypothetical protein
MIWDFGFMILELIVYDERAVRLTHLILYEWSSV